MREKLPESLEKAMRECDRNYDQERRENAARIGGKLQSYETFRESARYHAEVREKAIYEKHCVDLAKNDPTLVIPSDALVRVKDMQKTAARLRHNPELAMYYTKLAEETGNPLFREKARSVYTCAANWECTHYPHAGVTEMNRTYLCHDRFCRQCQKQLQKSRIVRFLPFMEKIAQKYDWYHLTLTIRNVNGAALAKAFDQLFDGFAYLIRLFSGNLNPKWHDFRRYDYVAALRNVELTFRGDAYHPHIHCFIALRQGLEFEKHIKNVYSKSRKEKRLRLFSDFEIVLQKAWRLHAEGKRITRESLAQSGDGYSVTLDRIEPGEYAEVFKYMIKPHKTFMTQKQFKVLYYATRRRRLMQGYGLLRHMTDEIDETDNPIYDKLHGQLILSGDPEKDIQSRDALEAAIKAGKTVISRKRIKPVGDDNQ